jgi:hypothetical protein
VPGKPIKLPPEVAKAFVRDMRAFFAEKSNIKADALAKLVEIGLKAKAK